MPRVSVLMPMRNTAAYARQACLSVLEQDLGDLELLVVDDGSTDGSRRAVESIRDARVSVLAGPGRGTAAAWNVALRASSGDVVVSCDSDDLLPPGRLSSQVRFLDAHPELGAVGGGFATMEPSGRLVSELWGADQPPEEITGELLSGRTRTCFNSFAVRRAHLVAVGGKREWFETAEDIDLQLRLAEVCRVWWEPVGTYLYRLHDASLTHTQPSARRVFFEACARELRVQRARGGPDDLQRGAPPSKPAGGSAPDGYRRQAQGMLIGEAWRSHARGTRGAALGLGLRAVALGPASVEAWRQLLLLAVKPARGTRP